MAHFKCVACRTRLYRAGGAPDEVGDLCSGCGSLLEPVTKLAEIVGFQSITGRDGASDGGVANAYIRLADRVGDLIARRDEINARTWLDARCVDDAGFAAEAMPRPETNL